MVKNDNIRVAHLVDTLRPGGAEMLAVKYSNGLAQLGVDVHLIASRSGGALAHSLNPRVKLFIGHRNSRFDLRGVKRILDYLKKNRVQIIHSHNSSSALLGRFLESFSLSRQRILVSHDHHNRENRWRAKTKFSFGRSRCHFVVSDDLKKWGIEYYSIRPEIIKVLPNAIDIEDFDKAEAMPVRDLFGIPEDHFVLVFVGNFRPEKGHLFLVEALRKLTCKERISTILVGQKVDSEYAMAVETAFKRHVLKCNLMHDRVDIPRILKGCDIGVLTSSFESGPIAVLEYMAAGLPFVCSDIGMCIDMLKNLRAVYPMCSFDEACGTIFQVNDLDGCLRSMMRILNDGKERRERMGHKGKLIVRRDFSIESRTKDILKEYQRLLKAI